MVPRLVLFALLASPFAFGCSCFTRGPQPCPWGKPGVIAFIGTVLSVENPPSQDDQGHMLDNGSGEARYRFRIDEALFGVKRPEVDIYSGRGGADCSYHFKAGKQYLVFPDKGSSGKLFANICSGTRAYDIDDPLIAQLRAIRDHKPAASVFGRLLKAVEPFAGPYETVPLSGIQIRFFETGGPQKVETTTNSTGIYEINDLAPGKYNLTATLPAGLGLTGSQWRTPLEFPGDACYELNLEAMPTGKIRGRVLNEKGENLIGNVELLRGSSYTAGARGPWDISGEDGFQFKDLPDGQYILVFNKDNVLDPDAPYPRTFYPGVTDPDKAVPIAVTDGKTMTADIHLSGGAPVHQLDVSVTWANSAPLKKDDSLWVSAQPLTGRGSLGEQTGPNVFRLKLLHGTRYTIHATMYCGEQCVENACRGRTIETPKTDFDVPGIPSSSLRISFTVNECPK